MTGPDLATTYLGLPLRTPLVVGAAGPLSDSIEALQELERCGAAAIVLHSLFEEQIEQEQLALHRYGQQGAESYGEALSYLPEAALEHGGADAYLRLIEQACRRLAIPVIASLNGRSPGRWVETARRIEAAGAAALELNIYAIPTDPELSSAAIEAQVEEIVREVRAEVALPLAVKLGPFFSNFGAMARRLEHSGAQGLVLFNRFYQPDIDIESMTVRPNLLLSTPHDLRLPLRWIALLHGRVGLDLIGSGGVHRGTDVVRLLMAGAAATQVVAALLRHGPGRLQGLEDELATWMRDHEVASVAALIGCMSQAHCPNPEEYERAQYMQAIHSYSPAGAATARGPW
ncbi:dihydroorotate dehydrogenase-like protein [Cyanobium sp. LEGE 06143]|uniref:dihydroorotate dehydrogenase-like protein n=1 Tax=Cyanobium sp. LEGE 06143 TaxID=945727 RepID=UPI00188275AC|nr:dihydroorotate dehydrogenase-like protein [Cyanobium sp. LEGE 06143]MBE9173388.1 dihydroorotate dehydrogenase-like protein [Cyanobium sp. LEGE 06143]